MSLLFSCEVIRKDDDNDNNDLDNTNVIDYDQIVMMSEGIVNARLYPDLEDDVDLRLSNISFTDYINEGFDSIIAELISLNANNDGMNYAEWIELQYVCKGLAQIIIYLDENEIDFLENNFVLKFDNDSDEDAYIKFEYDGKFVIAHIYVDYKGNDYYNMTTTYTKFGYNYIDDDNFTIYIYQDNDDINGYEDTAYAFYDTNIGFIFIATYDDNNTLQVTDIDNNLNYHYSFNEIIDNVTINELIGELKLYAQADNMDIIIESIKDSPVTVDIVFRDLLIDIMEQDGYYIS